MRFDDRLSTVLNHPARSGHDRAVRWRQLVDLLARAGSLEDSAHAEAALDLIRRDTPEINEELRSAAARAVAALPLPFELVALFARDKLKVSAPVLAAARLSQDQWQEIVEYADQETGHFIRTLQPGIGRASSGTTKRPVPVDASKPEQPSIKEVIHRIEALREAREQQPVAASPKVAEHSTSLAQGLEDKGLFRWECGPSGELDWVDGAPRAALIGRPLVEPGHDRESGSGEIARAFALRAPFSNALVTIAEDSALDGEWELTGIPAFDHSSGRFAGYRGVAKRMNAPAPMSEASAVPHPDALRELVHEIKTPLNAIMGFAEIIQAQMFGPAGNSYRSRAAEIVAQSHLLLAAIDDLDLAARLQAGQVQPDGETDLAAVLEEVIPEIEQKARKSGVDLRLLVEPHLPPCTVSPAVVERLLQRLLGGLIDCCEHGERLKITASQWNDSCTLGIDRPFALNGIGEQDLMDPGFSVPRQRNARLSLGFSLRLVRGIAQLAGGDLMISRRKVTLVLARGDLRPPASDRYRHSAGQGL